MVIVKQKASLVAQMVKDLPAIQETWLQSLGQEDHLEKGMTTHSSILAWRISGTWWATIHWVAKELDMTEATWYTYTYILCDSRD